MIKFRVFDKKENVYLPNHVIDNMPMYALNSKDYIIELATGLTDKNGKIIYEGDIVVHDKIGSTEVGICRYNEKWGVFMFHTSEDIDEAFTFFSVGYETKNSTVIGNINENKELLK